MRIKIVSAAVFICLLLCSCSETVNNGNSYGSETVTSSAGDSNIPERHENMPFCESGDTENSADQVFINPNPEKSSGSGGHSLAATPMTAET